MECYEDRAFLGSAEAGSGRILTTISGNAQLFAADSKHDATSQVALPAELKVDTTASEKQRYPAPVTLLRSNDRRVFLREKLNSRRLKRRLKLAQVYLNCPKYIAYLGRARRDTEKERNEVIWDEETEMAFQHAVINIPAMGKNKKSQHGKTFGRNELISEWIKQEVGKTRTRKQVSSHLQTLGKFFAPDPEEEFLGIPEWTLINKRPNDPTAEDDGPDFYENSIADMVRNWRMLQNGLSLLDTTITDAPPSHELESNVSSREPLLSRLEFEMWVSLPDSIGEVVHRYTRIQSNDGVPTVDVLDNVPSWRSSWPDLVPLVESYSHGRTFDIILLEASFETMLDFPPPRSKLGISLELDFTTAGSPPPTLNAAQSWSCVTHLYRRGTLEASIEHTGCHTPGFGRVKPPFQSRWWAEQFTKLTERHRQAAKSGNDAAMSLADESARSYFHNTKIMQQIFVECLVPFGAGVHKDRNSRPKLIAVLLWSFSQASPNFVGTTTWRRLVLPVQSGAADSLQSEEEVTLSPLPVNVVPGARFEEETLHARSSFALNTFESTVNTHPHEIDVDDDELCQDGYMMVNQHGIYAPTNMPYSDTQIVYDDHNPIYHNHLAYHYNLNHHHSDQEAIYHQSYADHAQSLPPGDLDDHQQDLDQFRPYQDWEYVQQSPADLDYMSRRQALQSFDANTHNLLQAQLRGPEELPTPINNCPDQAPSHNIHPSLAVGAIEDRQASTEPTTKVVASTSNETDLARPSYEDTIQHHGPHATISAPISPVVTIPTMPRPHLYHHHTFSGVFPAGFSANETVDDASQHDFTLLLNGLNTSHDDLLDSHLPPLPGSGGYGLGLDILRSHSQPPPVVSITRESTPVEAAGDQETSMHGGNMYSSEQSVHVINEGWVQVEAETAPMVDGSEDV